MKLRTRKRKRKPVYNRARRLLRIDPTRTTTLRRALAAEIKRRFSRLRLKVRDLIEREDAFGLVRRPNPLANAFCPTGPGGGVDPSCSPVESAAHREVARALTAAHPFPGPQPPLPAGVALPDAPPEVKAAHRKYLDHAAAYQRARAAEAAERLLTGKPPKLLPPEPDAPAGRQRALAKRAKEAAELAADDLDTLGGDGWAKYREAVSASHPGGKDALEAARKEAERRHREAAENWVRHQEAWRKVRGPLGNALVVNERWRHLPDPDKLAQFKAWLREQVQGEILSDEQLWTRYAQEGFRKGAGRAFDDVRRRGPVPSADFYEGSRQEFLRSAFARPVAVEKVKLIAGRAFDDLEGVTAEMSTRMVRHLADGLVQGKGPKEIAQALAADVDGIGQRRALLIAQTEIISAHAEGQLTAFEQLGVEELGVAAEWVTAGDEGVCEQCVALEGVILKVEEARGMLPRHPNCRCAWLPAGVGESDEGRKESKSSIDRAVRASRRGEDDEWGPGAPIAKTRPESILENALSPALLAFSRFLAKET